MLSDDLAELPAGLDRLQATVKVDGSFEAFMPEEAPDRLVIAGMVLQVDCGRCVPELVDGNPQSGCFLDSLRDLDAKQMRVLRSSRRPRKQPISIRTAQARTILLNIFVNQIGQVVIELKVSSTRFLTS